MSKLPSRPRLLFVVNADWFFVSHRLSLARACREAGFEVYVCAGESEARKLIEAEGFEFYSLPIDRGGTNPRRDWKTLAYLVGLYRRLRPDVVHHVTIKPVLYGGLAARLLGIPAVAAVSGLGYMFIPQKEEGVKRRAIRRGLENLYRLVLAESSRCRVIFQNPDDRGQFLELGLVRAEQSVMLPGSGVDLERFPKTPLPSGPPVVLMPARLLRDKGVGEFVEASRIVKNHVPEARFVLLGRIDPGNPSAISESEVKAWVDDGVIEWWGAAASADMPRHYQAASLVVLPSYREGLALVLPEAGATGRAVVTTDVPGCRDAVLENESGWLVPARTIEPLAAAILEALQYPDELEKRSERAYVLARTSFRQELVFDGTLAQYAKLGVIATPGKKCPSL